MAKTEEKEEEVADTTADEIDMLSRLFATYRENMWGAEASGRFLRLWCLYSEIETFLKEKLRERLE